MTRIRIWSIGLLAVVLASCGGGCVDCEHASDTHATCTVESYNNEWPIGLKLIHDDQRDCPLNLGYGEHVGTSGTIVDTRLDYPDLTESSSADVALLGVWDDYYQGENLLGWRTDYFAFDWPTYDTSKSFEWQVYLVVNYDRGYNPDYAEFRVGFVNPVLYPDAIAHVSITYGSEIY
jgi:hypothetical protein